MLDSQASTIADSHQSTPEPALASSSLKLSKLPKVFVLPTHLNALELRSIENILEDAEALVTSTISEASLVLTAVTSLRRVRFELQTRQLDVEVVAAPPTKYNVSEEAGPLVEDPNGKRKRDKSSSPISSQHPDVLSGFKDPLEHKIGQVKVVKTDWLRESFKQREILSLSPYFVCIANIKAQSPQSSQHHGRDVTARYSYPQEGGLVSRSESTVNAVHKFRKTSLKPSSKRRKDNIPAVPALERESTSEHDMRTHMTLPEMPEWVEKRQIYACQRHTPAESLNEDFISMLKQIRHSRVLTEDEIGVRAYSTSIASIAAYPYKLSGPQEILKLPGCEKKIARLFREYQSTGQVSAAKAVEQDPVLRTINDFYNIWGVGAKTARGFYDRGWRDHDDVVEQGWNNLSRAQQIGLKYFEEFELKIPRKEVEAIAEAITFHARALTDEKLVCTIVGGYRRGKSESGDVDVVLSHPDESATLNMIRDLVLNLETANFVSHTLILSEKNSSRGQQTLGLKMGDQKGGFDTLDKALLVWQHNDWSGREELERSGADPDVLKKNNPNPHRRVDIIISPWRTVGCAIAGWSSGTTFQRDLRRWARKEHGWKFDSSGVRDRASGKWIDLEKWSNPATRAKTVLEAEKRVFEGLGLPYLEPSERCTG